MKVDAKQDRPTFTPVTVSLTLESQDEVDVLVAFCGANGSMAKAAVDQGVIPAEAQQTLGSNLGALFIAAQSFATVRTF
jgi:hypothetical protein